MIRRESVEVTNDKAENEVEDAGKSNHIQRGTELVDIIPSSSKAHQRRPTRRDEFGNKIPSTCEHKRHYTQCVKCGGSNICVHRRQRSKCYECGGSSLCEHRREKNQCKECNGGAICSHGRQKRYCRDCDGKGLCPHAKQKSKCVDCGGVSVCVHKRERLYCKDCGGAGICIHKRIRRSCKDCGYGPVRSPKRPLVEEASLSAQGLTFYELQSYARQRFVDAISQVPQFSVQEGAQVPSVMGNQLIGGIPEQLQQLQQLLQHQQIQQQIQMQQYHQQLKQHVQHQLDLQRTATAAASGLQQNQQNMHLQQQIFQHQQQLVRQHQLHLQHLAQMHNFKIQYNLQHQQLLHQHGESTDIDGIVDDRVISFYEQDQDPPQVLGAIDFDQSAADQLTELLGGGI